MRVVLDTGVLFHPKALLALAQEEGEVVLPAVAYAERVRQLASQGRDIEEFDVWLRKNDIDVEPFGATHARRIVPRVKDASWGRLARDAMIAGHVGPEDVLWTTNPTDFRELGLEPFQIWAVPRKDPAVPA